MTRRIMSPARYMSVRVIFLYAVVALVYGVAVNVALLVYWARGRAWAGAAARLPRLPQALQPHRAPAAHRPQRVHS